MDWMQVLTILGATVGSTYVFYLITEKRIDHLNEALIRLDDKWDARFFALDEKWESRFVAIDEKWERLFERLLIQDKK
jgi:hypothetical protein